MQRSTYFILREIEPISMNLKGISAERKQNKFSNRYIKLRSSSLFRFPLKKQKKKKRKQKKNK